MNRRVIGIFGTAGGVCFSTSGFEQALNDIGHNTGNAMFQRAVWDRVMLPKVLVNLQNWRTFVGRIDLLVIPAANQVNPQWDLSSWAEMVEGLNVPVCIVGLGAQAHIGSEAKLNLTPGTMRFLSLVSERARTIGVRGRFTQEVLAALGIHNTVVTGCPSNFLNPNLTGASIAARLDRVHKLKSYRMGYVFGTMEEVTRSVEKELFRLARDHEAEVIYQTNPGILRFLYDGTLTPESENYLKWESSVLGEGALDVQEHKRLMRKRGTFFSDARTWIDMMASYDLVIGMRIHGAIAAIQAGTLGLCVPFDSRTLELVDTMKYPMVNLSDIEPGIELPAILSRVKFDPSQFDTTRESLKVALNDIFDHAELTYKN